MKRKQNFFLRNMLHYWYLPPCEIILLSLLNFAIVRGNRVISAVIDRMLSGETIILSSFLTEFLLLTLTGFAAAFIASAVASKYGLLVFTRYCRQVTQKLYCLEYRYFDEHNSASVINKINADLGEVQNFLCDAFVKLLTDGIAVIIYANYVRTLNTGLFIMVLVCYPLVLWIANKLVQKIRSLSKTYRAKSDTITEIVQDVLNGILVVRSFSLEPYFQQKMHAATLDLVDNEEKRVKISNTALLIRKMIQWIPNIICAIYSIILVMRGDLSIGELLAFILILSKLVDAFIGIPFSMVDAAGSFVSIQRVEEILNAPEEISGQEDAPLDTEVVLSFDNVCFGYHKEHPVLENASFTIRKGENVAFAGESGGGKSTIFHLLCGFYQPQDGEYLLYGRRFSDWDINKARSLFSLVSQNVFLFPTTIEENVRYGNWDASMQDVIKACQDAEIHDFIQTLPLQYQTIVGERGAMLSGGQRQRIAIARAILKNAPILLFDEPTSAIDEETEKEIQRAISKVSAEKTCLTIAHRLSTIKDADRIYVVKNKKVEEAGTYEEYMETVL